MKTRKKGIWRLVDWLGLATWTTCTIICWWYYANWLLMCFGVIVICLWLWILCKAKTRRVEWPPACRGWLFWSGHPLRDKIVAGLIVIVMIGCIIGVLHEAMFLGVMLFERESSIFIDLDFAATLFLYICAFLMVYLCHLIMRLIGIIWHIGLVFKRGEK